MNSRLNRRHNEQANAGLILYIRGLNREPGLPKTGLALTLGSYQTDLKASTLNPAESETPPLSGKRKRGTK